MELMAEYLELWLLGLAAFNLVLIIFIIILFVRMSKMKSRMRKMLGTTGNITIEDALIQNQIKLEKVQELQSKFNQELLTVAKRLETMKAKVAAIRYNAFHETGSDLSFSIAVVDERGNGYVLTGIHTRHDSQIYAKPLENGRSSYPLTPEEIDAINQALQSE